MDVYIAKLIKNHIIKENNEMVFPDCVVSVKKEHLLIFDNGVAKLEETLKITDNYALLYM